MLLNKHIADVDESDLLALINAGVAEGRHIEYKRELFGQTNREKLKAPVQASSFANTGGGHLLLGMRAAGGIPKELVGLNDIDTDHEILRLEQLIRDGTQPSLTGLQIRAIPLTAGRGHAIVLWIPKSWNPPHRVVAQGDNRFYLRNSAGKYQPDVDELRMLFSMSASVTEKAETFRAGRVDRVESGHGELTQVADNFTVFVHMIPFGAFNFGHSVDIHRAHEMLTQRFRPIYSHGMSPGYNFDGAIVRTGVDRVLGYTQVRREGIVEAASNLPTLSADQFDRRAIEGGIVEDKVAEVLPSYLAGLQELGVSPPIGILITLRRVQGLMMRRGYSRSHRAIDRNELALPGVVISDYGDPAGHVRECRPAFNALWNAAGFAQSPHADTDGTNTA